MRAISLWQPWASLLVFGLKRFETRAYPFPASLRGHRIAIHAAKKDVAMDPQFARAVFQMLTDAGMSRDQVAFGAIVGTLELRDAYQMGSHIEGASRSRLWDVKELVDRRCPASVDVATEAALGDFRLDRWAWECVKPHALAKPIPYMGKQGFFDVTGPGVLNLLNASDDEPKPITRGEISRPIVTINEGAVPHDAK